LFTPNVGVEHFWVDLVKCMFCAYSQCRSSAFIWWSVRDLDLASMLNFSTWVNNV